MFLVGKVASQGVSIQCYLTVTADPCDVYKESVSLIVYVSVCVCIPLGWGLRNTEGEAKLLELQLQV